MTVTGTAPAVIVTGIVPAVTGIVTGMSEIIIAVIVMAGIVTITGLGIQRKDEMTEGIVKVADIDALALVTGAEAGAEAGAAAGAGTNSVPVLLGMQTKIRQLLSPAT